MGCVPTGAPREWISFDDEHEERTWMFDATFLRSRHTCIYGSGCQGIGDRPAPELAQGCCSVGAHLVDEDDVANLVRHVVRLSPDQWQFHDRARRSGFLRAGEEGGDGAAATVTRLVDGACVFLNRPGFGRGPGCALHVGALDAGERPLDWKPNVCWQVPIRVDHLADEAMDARGHVVTRVREWERRDWGADAGLAWWCTEAPEAHVGADPVYRTCRDELVELVGASNYERLVDLLERPVAVPLPHPAVGRSPSS